MSKAPDGTPALSFSTPRTRESFTLQERIDFQSGQISDLYYASTIVRRWAANSAEDKDWIGFAFCSILTSEGSPREGERWDYYSPFFTAGYTALWRRDGIVQPLSIHNEYCTSYHEAAITIINREFDTLMDMLPFRDRQLIFDGALDRVHRFVERWASAPRHPLVETIDAMCTLECVQAIMAADFLPDPETDDEVEEVSSANDVRDAFMKKREAEGATYSQISAEVKREFSELLSPRGCKLAINRFCKRKRLSPVRRR